VSTQSRRRDDATQAPPSALFAEMLRAARELLAVRSPLDAELMVSELLGTWWGRTLPPAGAKRGDSAIPASASSSAVPTGPAGHAGPAAHIIHDPHDVEDVVGGGLVGYAARQATPAALALLAGIACLGTTRQAAAAEQAALELMERGVRRPRWADHVGAVAPGDCYVNHDVYGDRDEVVCTFSYAGEEPHALVVAIDYNARGMIRDGWVTSEVEKLLGRSRQGGSAAAGGAQLEPIPAGQARRMLATGLAETDSATDPPVSESFPAYHAFIRARVRTLPPGRGAAASVPAARRPPWSKDRRAMLAAEFLASDEAEDLSDRQAASRCADHIIDYGCDQDFNRPLRVSPVKAQRFLLDWLPRKVMLAPEEQHAMPHVLAAWVRWAGKRQGLGADAIRESMDAVFDSMGAFARTYHDPAAFGLDRKLVGRLLPDGDLEALARRAFAFPLLDGRSGGVDLGALDPSGEKDRRTLLEAAHATGGHADGPDGTDDAAADADHFAEFGRDGRRGPGGGSAGSARSAGSAGFRELRSEAARRHIDRHLELADRLWRGDPPELWDAGQRLLDRGTKRHRALHMLMDAISEAGPWRSEIIAALNDLPR
jgi:hypothetical protein